MTQEERIANLEQQVLDLQEELKRTRKANVWKKVKDKFKSELDSFNWIHTHTFTNCNGFLISNETYMSESEHISQAIGTIVRVILKRKGLNYLEENDYEKAERTTKQILEIMKKERENK